MPSTQITAVPSKYIENSQTTQYIPDGVKFVIDKCVVTNISSNNGIMSINIVDNGNSPSAVNRLISNRLIRPDESYECPEIVGCVLESRDYISAISDTASALIIFVSGREIS